MRVPRGDLARSYVAVMLLNAPDGLVSTLAPPFLGSLGYPVGQIGFLVSGYAVASLAARLPAGRLADSRYARPSFIVACLVYAVALALYPIAVEPWSFWTVRALHGLAVGAAGTLNFASFLSAAAGEHRVRATSYFATAMSAGYGIGNFASGFLADHFGFGTAFVVAGLTAALGVLVAPGPEVEAAGASTAAPPVRLRDAIRRGEVLVIPLLAFSVNFTHQALNTLYPLYVVGIGLSLSIAGTSRGVQSFSNTIMRPFGSHSERVLGSTGMAVVGLIGTAVAIAAIPLLTTPLLLVGVFALLGVARSFSTLSNALTASEMASRNVVKRGVASSLLTIGQDIGGIMAPVIAGLTAQAIGIGGTLQLLPALMAVLGTVAVLRVRATVRRQAAAAPP